MKLSASGINPFSKYYMKKYEEAKSFSVYRHNIINQLYDVHPYPLHLQMVENVAKDFIYLIPKNNKTIYEILASCWTHDLKEDCGIEISELKRRFGKRVAAITEALTALPGTRKERLKNTCDKIRETEFATFVKLCDRIANVQYSKKYSPAKFAMYKKEHNNFIEKLYDPKYKPMFEILNGYFNHYCL